MTDRIDRKRSESRETLLAVLLIGLHGLCLGLLVFFRYIDGDEGFYLSAAHQVALGRVLYSDFFFPQMPLLPMVQSIVSGHAFDTLWYSRLLGVLPAIGGAVIFWLILRRLTEDSLVRVFSLFLYCSSCLLLVWHSVAKTYAWTDFALLAMLWTLLQSQKSKRMVWILAAGLAFGLAANFRSVLVVSIVPVIYLIHHGKVGSRAAAYGLFVIGALVVSIPSLLLLAHDPARFYFDNLGFHLMRNPGVSPADALLERGSVALKLLVNPQHWIIGLGVWLGWSQSDKGNRGIVTGSLLLAGVIAIVYFLPSPIHMQYFEQAIPFALLAAVPGFERLLNSRGDRVSGVRKDRAVMLLAAVQLVVWIPFYLIFVQAARSENRAYQITNVKQVCEYVGTYPGTGPVFSEWAGITVLSGREGYAGTEFIGFDYHLPVNDSTMRFYRLPVNSDLANGLSERIPALYVVWERPDTALADVARRNYREAASFDQYKVLVRNEDGE